MTDIHIFCFAKFVSQLMQQKNALADRFKQNKNGTVLLFVVIYLLGNSKAATTHEPKCHTVGFFVLLGLSDAFHTRPIWLNHFLKQASLMFPVFFVSFR